MGEQLSGVTLVHMRDRETLRSGAYKRRIFIIDDHPVVRDGLKGMIGQQTDLLVCGEAADAATGLSGVKASSPDLILLDLSLANSSGLELLKDLIIQHAHVPVLILSMHDEMVYADRVLRSGARGYVMKGEGSEQLLTAIRRVLLGKVYLSENVMTDIASKLGKPKAGLDAIARLSDRELQVFEMIGAGNSIAGIATQMNVSIKTVQEYVARAKDKFGVQTMKALLRAAFRWQDMESAVDVKTKEEMGATIGGLKK